MLFSSLVFLLCFLPMVLLIYYVVLRKSRKWQNIFLFLASLGFYAWGEPKFVLILMLSVIVNWFIGYQIDIKRHREKLTKLLVFIDVLYNLSIIFVFKYLTFTMDNIVNIFGVTYEVPQIALPIGISFFTFQAISYVVDVYRKEGEAQKTPLNVGLYIAFFPQLIAGPIVRYNTVAEQIKYRKENFNVFSEGVCRFIIGLSKKVLLANSFARLADLSFNPLYADTLTVDMAWIGAIAYTLQIYYDFSGYSDMAIGLGKMFGFEFEENFNYPYISQSTSEFWRRWHISLGRWFRDYVYIPLGGNRSNITFNLFVVWLLTGIWHGANFTFILWGLMYFVSISVEKKLKIEKIKGYSFIKRLYTLLLVVFGWVMFRSLTVEGAFHYMQRMLYMGDTGVNVDYFLYIVREHIAIIVTGFLFATPIYGNVQKSKLGQSYLGKIFYVIGICFLLLISISFLVKGSYNPFIYFNF